MPEEKNYINGIIIKERAFDNGGTQLKVSIKLDEFIEQLKECDQDKDFKGWVNCIIARRLEPSDKGVTHYLYEDTWRPDPKYRADNQSDPEMYSVHQANSEKPKNDLPF